MPIEYDIQELAGRPIWRDTKPTKTEALAEAARLRDKEHKNFEVVPHYIPANEALKPVKLVTAERLYRDISEDDSRLEDQPLKTRILFESLADAANEVFAEHLPEAEQILSKRSGA